MNTNDFHASRILLLGLLGAVLTFAGCLVTPAAAAEPTADEDMGMVVLKDYRTGEITTRPGRSLAEFRALAQQYQAARGLRELPDRVWMPGSDDVEETPAQKNFGSFTEVLDPDVGTYPRSVKIKMTFTNQNNMQKNFECSGTLIDPRTVITAGHCVYAWEDENNVPIEAWADAITVYPGYDDGAQSPIFKTAQAVQLLSWTGWTQNEDYDSDIGIIGLDRPVGALTGWWGVGHAASCSWFESNLWWHRVYPGANGYTGSDMFERTGDYDDCGGGQASFNSLGVGGTSGGGGLKESVIWTVRSNSTNGDTGHDVKISSEKLADMATFMDSNMPNGVDLQVLGTSIDESGQNVNLGTTLNRFRFTILNYGKSTYNGTLSFDVMMSTDNVIDGGDRVIGSYSINLVLPTRGTAAIDVPGPTLPMDTAAAFYILAPRLNLNDANNGNNVPGILDQDWINAVCPFLAAPVQTYPVDNATCMPTGFTLTWNPVANANGYEVRVGTGGCYSGMLYTVGTSTSLPISGLQYDTTYRWVVRPKTACGVSGDWSECHEFTTEQEPVSNFTFVSPPDGDACQDATSVTIDWQDHPNVVAWQIRCWLYCGTGNILNANGSSMFTFTGLEPNQTYYYQVRGRTACADWGAWTTCRSFTTKPDPMPGPTSFLPVDGATCVASSYAVSWNPVPGAASFDVELGPQGGPFQQTSVAAPYQSLSFTNLSEGIYSWRVRAVHACGDVSAWSNWMDFHVDATAPTPASSLSSSLPVGSWSADNVMSLQWTAGADANCLVKYQVQWDHSPADPASYDHLTFQTFIDSDPLPDGQDIYVHLQTLDVAGNVAPQVLTMGPFWIDSMPPTDPSVNASVEANTWVSTSEITWTYGGSVDTGAGLAGYAVMASQDPNAYPSLADLTTDTSYTLQNPSDGAWYFLLRAADALMNASPVMVFGPYLVDASAPLVVLLEPLGGELTQGEDATIAWDAGDECSGLTTLQIDYSVDGRATWTPITTLDVTEPPGVPKTIGRYSWMVPFAPSNEGYVRVRAFDAAGLMSEDTNDEPIQFIAVTATQGLPTVDHFALEGNHPNPFNPQTTIQYSIPSRARVELAVYDLQGRLVKRLVDAVLDGPARYDVTWNGRSESGESVASGVYFYRLRAGDFMESKRMTLLK